MSSERTQGQSLRHFAARFREPAAGKQRRPANHAVSTAVVLAVVVAVAYSAISITPATAATRFADAWTSAIEPGITAGSRVTSEVACYNTTLKITASSSEQDKDDALSAVRCLLNNERLAWDLPDLTPFAMLDEAARVHNAWMAGTHVFDHLETGAGSLPTPPDRVAAAGYNWSFVAENIAAGQTTARSVVDGWLHSVGHCKNILSPNPTDFGVAVSTGYVSVGASNVSPIWTNVFARWSGAPAPSSETAGMLACDAGLGFEPRSGELRNQAEPAITVTDGAGHPVASSVNETHNPGYGTEMERIFTLTNTSATAIVNPSFVATMTDRPLDQPWLGIGDVTCVFDDPDTPQVVLVEQDCMGTGEGDGRLYIPTTISPGESVKVKVGSYNGPSLEKLTGNVTGFQVTFGGRVTESGSYVPSATGDRVFSMRWSWVISRTSVGFGIPSVQDKPTADLVIGANGTTTWRVPVYNKGADTLPLAAVIFVSAARGAKIVSASLPGASCVAGKSYADSSNGVRCTLPAGTLTSNATRQLTIVARPKTATKAKAGGKYLDRGAIGVAMSIGSDKSLLLAFKTDVAVGGPFFDTLPADYLGVRKGRVKPDSNLDNKMRAAGFCVKGNDCDLNLNGQWDSQEGSKAKGGTPSKLTVKAKGAKRKVFFAVKVTAKKKPAKGYVTVSRGKKLLKIVVLKKGKASITLAKQAKGTGKYTITYRGRGTVLKSTRTLTVKIR